MEKKDEWKSQTNYESKAHNWRLRDQLAPNLKERWTRFFYKIKINIIFYP